ncbi:MAG: Hsp20/alpha crystallin family protein [Methanothrix sp.]
MPGKKKKGSNKDQNLNGAPDIENLIKLIAKTLKENFDTNDMASMANEFGIDIKLSANQSKSVPPTKPMRLKKPEPQLPHGMPLEIQTPTEPFVETMYKKDSVVIDASMPNVSKEEINVIASQGTLIIEISHKGTIYSKKLQLEANVDPERASATFKNGVLEVVMPIVDMAYMKDFKLNIK